MNSGFLHRLTARAIGEAPAARLSLMITPESIPITLPAADAHRYAPENPVWPSPPTHQRRGPLPSSESIPHSAYPSAQPVPPIEGPGDALSSELESEAGAMAAAGNAENMVDAAADVPETFASREATGIPYTEVVRSMKDAGYATEEQNQQGSSATERDGIHESPAGPSTEGPSMRIGAVSNATTQKNALPTGDRAFTVHEDTVSAPAAPRPAIPERADSSQTAIFTSFDDGISEHPGSRDREKVMQGRRDEHANKGLFSQETGKDQILTGDRSAANPKAHVPVLTAEPAIRQFARASEKAPVASGSKGQTASDVQGERQRMIPPEDAGIITDTARAKASPSNGQGAHAPAEHPASRTTGPGSPAPRALTSSRHTGRHQSVSAVLRREDEQPVVVRIGRVEVRAVMQPPPSPPKGTRRGPTLSLDEYLKQQRGA